MIDDLARQVRVGGLELRGHSLREGSVVEDLYGEDMHVLWAGYARTHLPAQLERRGEISIVNIGEVHRLPERRSRHAVPAARVCLRCANGVEDDETLISHDEVEKIQSSHRAILDDIGVRVAVRAGLQSGAKIAG